MTILTPVTFICAFPMQRAFVKVLIFLYGFCLERSLLLRISWSVVNLLYLAFVYSVAISSCSMGICSLL